ncbi:MAG: D-erythrulose kinase, partial [Candidatus Hydrogenedens sp.]|nr:D-erythrulose kinase [Candidatus Hydrogenedens sp.]
MARQVTFETMLRMLRGAAAEIRANHELLGRLDSVGGDGDHGTTMVRAMARLEQAADAADGGL